MIRLILYIGITNPNIPLDYVLKVHTPNVDMNYCDRSTPHFRSLQKEHSQLKGMHGTWNYFFI